MTETCRFGVRRDVNGRSPACFEVFDRMAGTTVASEMSRIEAEAEARRRNHDPSGEPAELTALRSAIDVLVAQAGRRSLLLVARAAQALDEIREELAQTDRMIGDLQARIGQLRKRLPGADTDFE